MKTVVSVIAIAMCSFATISASAQKNNLSRRTKIGAYTMALPVEN